VLAFLLRGNHTVLVLSAIWPNPDLALLGTLTPENEISRWG